jgi:hypothetical protein
MTAGDDDRALGYLSSAFAVGSTRVVSIQSVAVAAAGGMLAAIVAVLSPLRDILSPRPACGDRTSGAGRAKAAPLTAAGVACLIIAAAILLVAPQQAILGMVSLTGTRCCCCRSR